MDNPARVSPVYQLLDGSDAVFYHRCGHRGWIVATASISNYLHCLLAVGLGAEHLYPWNER